MRDLAADYVATEGELPIKNLVWHGQPVGQWIRDQREAYRKRTLRADRVAILRRIRGWGWNAEESDFSQGLTHFVTYRCRYTQGWVRCATSARTATRSGHGHASGAGTAACRWLLLGAAG
jgi:hypothetical protein